MYPAKNGDAFIINFDSVNVLIDAGYASTYHDYIAKDLIDFESSGRKLDLVVCTHIDADHIGGLLEFFSNNGMQDAIRIKVDAVWHNSLRCLPALNEHPLTIGDQKILEAIRRRGFKTDANRSYKPISARQGSSLATLLQERGYNWNLGCSKKSIDDSSEILLPDDVGIKAIGPRKVRLEALRDFWLKEVRKIGFSGAMETSSLIDDAYEMFLANAHAPLIPKATLISVGERTLAEVYASDNSVTNGSSIALIISKGERKALFLGDAWAEDVIEGLRILHQSDSIILFDAIKLSHHGSVHNTSVELLSLIDSPCFLISSDGSRHSHPDFEVLAEIVDRPAPFTRRVFFNYETPASTKLKSHLSRSGAPFSVHVGVRDWIRIGENNHV